MTSRGRALYVCTSTSGGRIYKVSSKGVVSLWFDVQNAMRSTGHTLSNYDKIHGGLRSVAFHPKFTQNGLFYTAVMEQKNWSRKPQYFSRSPQKASPGDSVVIEWQLNLKTGRPKPGSYRQVIRVEMPVYDHPIRGLLFEGNLLYIAHGDGSVGSDTSGGGQRNDGLGKILRINPLRSGGKPYSIPGSNPFVGKSRFKDEIYALGFRNPIHMCVSKYKSLGLIVVDVGRDNADEINLVEPGGNYGWARREGTFVNLRQGGLVTGVRPLPADDAKYGFIYPVVQVGHYGVKRGAKIIGQALTGSCPIENGSPLNNVMLYANFASNGELYYSNIWEMASAKTKGNPKTLTRANTYRPKIFFDHDNNPRTPPKRVGDLRDIIRFSRGGAGRADIRFGRGWRGEIYWSSKQNGNIYLITSSVPGAKV